MAFLVFCVSSGTEKEWSLSLTLKIALATALSGSPERETRSFVEQGTDEKAKARGYPLAGRSLQFADTTDAVTPQCLSRFLRLPKHLGLRFVRSTFPHSHANTLIPSTMSLSPKDDP